MDNMTFPTTFYFENFQLGTFIIMLIQVCYLWASEFSCLSQRSMFS